MGINEIMGNSGPTQWEYYVLIAGQTNFDIDVETMLNDMGEQGWQLCETFATIEEGRQLIFKRPKRSKAIVPEIMIPKELIHDFLKEWDDADDDEMAYDAIQALRLQIEKGDADVTEG